MIFHVPVRHRLDLLPKRARKLVRTFGTTEIAVDVLSVSGDAAPVALMLEGEKPIRYHDGRLWRPRPNAAFPEAVLASEIASFVGSAHLDGRTSGSTLAGRLVEDPGRGGDVVSDHSQLVAREIVRWVDEELLLVDGAVMVRARSPVLHPDLLIVSGDGCFDEEALRRAWNEPDLAPTDDRVPAWFADEADLADLRARVARADARGPGVRLLAEKLLFEIVDREAVAEASRSAARNSDLTRLRDVLMTGWFDALPRDDAYAKVRLVVERSRFAMDAAARESVASDPSSVAAAFDAMADVRRDLPTRSNKGGRRADAPTSSLEVPYVVRTENAFGIRPKGGWGSKGNHVVRTVSVDAPLFDAADLVLVAETSQGRVHRASDGTWLLERPDIDAIPAAEPGTENPEIHRRRVYAFVEALRRCASRALPRDGWDGEKDETFAERSFAEPKVRRFLASRAAIVDGRMFFVVSEPVLQVDVGDYGASVVIRFSGPGGTTEDMERPVFRLDRMDEAVAFADRTAPREPDCRTTVLDVSHFEFSDDSWNLKVSMAAIVPAMDGRMRLMDAGRAKAFLDVALHLAAWAADSSSVASPDEETLFVSASGVVLDTLTDPIYDDVGSEAHRAVAGVAQDRLARRTPAPAETDDPDREWTVLSM